MRVAQLRNRGRQSAIRVRSRGAHAPCLPRCADGARPEALAARCVARRRMSRSTFPSRLWPALEVTRTQERSVALTSGGADTDAELAASIDGGATSFFDRCVFHVFGRGDAEFGRAGVQPFLRRGPGSACARDTTTVAPRPASSAVMNVRRSILTSPCQQELELLRRHACRSLRHLAQYARLSSPSGGAVKVHGRATAPLWVSCTDDRSGHAHLRVILPLRPTPGRSESPPNCSACRKGSKSPPPMRPIPPTVCGARTRSAKSRRWFWRTAQRSMTVASSPNIWIISPAAGGSFRPSRRRASRPCGCKRSATGSTTPLY